MATYKVGDDGKAQKGLKSGDKVVTGGGTYSIDEVNSDGTYKSSKVGDATTSSYLGSYADGTPNSVGVSRKTSADSAASSNGSSDSSITDHLSDLAEAQKQAKISQLDSALNSKLSALDTEQKAIKNTYYNKRNEAAANSDVAAYNFAQYMGTRGITGNTGAMPEFYRNAGLQNTLGTLGAQEAQANTDIENQRATLKKNYQSDLQSAQS